MSLILFTLFLISLAVLILGLIKPNLIRISSRKDVLLKVGSSFILLFILFAFSVRKNSNQTSLETQNQTIENKLKSLSSPSISFKKFEINDNNTIVVSFAIFSSENLQNKTGELSSKVFKTIYNSTNTNDITIWYFGDKMDRYGNKTTDVLQTYRIDNKTFNKINWGNFDTSNLCTFLNEESAINGNNMSTGCRILN